MFKFQIFLTPRGYTLYCFLFQNMTEKGKKGANKSLNRIAGLILSLALNLEQDSIKKFHDKSSFYFEGTLQAYFWKMPISWVKNNFCSKTWLKPKCGLNFRQIFEK